MTKTNIIKKTSSLLLVVLLVAGTSLTTFAATTYSTTPAEAVAGLTNRTTDEVIAERYETGKTYGTIANEAGVLAQYQEEMLEMKIDIVNQRVEDGTLTRAQADDFIAEIQANQAVCDGTGSAGIGRGYGIGFGAGGGTGQGNRGANRGNGAGAGRGYGQGICIYN